jgi:hypothetical protein
MKVKLKCYCGRKIVFDIEPVEDRMPHAVSCPSCDGDITQYANHFITQMLSIKPSAPATPQPIESTVTKPDEPKAVTPIEPKATNPETPAKVVAFINAVNLKKRWPLLVTVLAVIVVAGLSLGLRQPTTLEGNVYLVNADMQTRNIPDASVAVLTKQGLSEWIREVDRQAGEATGNTRQKETDLVNKFQGVMDEQKAIVESANVSNAQTKNVSQQYQKAAMLYAPLATAVDQLASSIDSRLTAGDRTAFQTRHQEWRRCKDFYLTGFTRQTLTLSGDKELFLGGLFESNMTQIATIFSQRDKKEYTMAKASQKLSVRPSRRSSSYTVKIALDKANASVRFVETATKLWSDVQARAQERETIVDLRSKLFSTQIGSGRVDQGKMRSLDKQASAHLLELKKLELERVAILSGIPKVALYELKNRGDYSDFLRFCTTDMEGKFTVEVPKGSEYHIFSDVEVNFSLLDAKGNNDVFFYKRVAADKDSKHSITINKSNLINLPEEYSRIGFRKLEPSISIVELEKKNASNVRTNGAAIK